MDHVTDFNHTIHTTTSGKLKNVYIMIINNISDKIEQTRLPSNLRWDHPWMRAFSYTCSLPVMRQRWWLHHLICHTHNSMLHSNSMAVCLTEWELLLIEVLHCRNKNFLKPFRLIWPWPWPDNLHIRTWPVVHRDTRHMQNELPMSRFTKVIVWHIQTWPKLYTMPLRGWSKIKFQEQVTGITKFKSRSLLCKCHFPEIY